MIGWDKRSVSHVYLSDCDVAFRGNEIVHVSHYREKGVNIGIGTDVYPHNMLDEMRLARCVARLRAENPLVDLCARRIHRCDDEWRLIQTANA